MLNVHVMVLLAVLGLLVGGILKVLTDRKE